MDKGDVLVACLNARLESDAGRHRMGEEIIKQTFQLALDEGMPAEEVTQMFREAFPVVTRELGEGY